MLTNVEAMTSQWSERVGAGRGARADSFRARRLHRTQQMRLSLIASD
jgi:hypothetical protein